MFDSSHSQLLDIPKQISGDCLLRVELLRQCIADIIAFDSLVGREVHIQVHISR